MKQATILFIGNLVNGFLVVLLIAKNGKYPLCQIIGELPPFPHLLEYYQQWKSAYLMQGLRGIKVNPAQVTNYSVVNSSETLVRNFNEWLKSESFRDIRETLLRTLAPHEEVRIVVQSDNDDLWRLPWNTWDLYDRFPKSEIAISRPTFDKIAFPKKKGDRLKILVIIGNDANIDVETDRKAIAQLPNADIEFLVKPQPEEISNYLWDQSWDILFYAGHSHTKGKTGYLHINECDRLSISALKPALKQAISQGLQLAIFNSCDGLGLARQLTDLHIPELIVMREPIPDKIAQEFLKYFLQAFTTGKSLYLSVRETRERLQCLENKFFCASWFPVLFHNPSSHPIAWLH